jgi:hypothetical protein
MTNKPLENFINDLLCTIAQLRMKDNSIEWRSCCDEITERINYKKEELTNDNY